MPSPKSGSAGSLVSPATPSDAADAQKNDTGSNTTISNSGSKTGSASSSVQVKGGAGGGGGDGAASADPPPPEHKPDENPDKTSWIELQLVYESNGLPVAGMSYEVTLPDGKTVASGTTDDQGLARVDCIDPGSCQISFVDLDKEAWADA